MLRSFILLCLVAGVSAPALACDMRSSARADALVDYVTDGQACLETVPETFRFDEEIEQQFQRKINQERDERDLPRLKIRTELLPAARFHSLDMGVNAFFGHRSPAGLAHSDRIAAFDRQLLSDRSAENVAQFGPAICMDQNDKEVSCLLAPGFKLPTRTLVSNDLHQKLMLSDGHRENILDPDMTHMAVGVARTDTGFYVTQLFVSDVGSFDTPVPLQLQAGSRLEFNADVEGWDSVAFAVSKDEDPIDLTNQTLPKDLSEDVLLNIRAERVTIVQDGPRERQSVYWIYLSGPKVTVVPAKGS